MKLSNATALLVLLLAVTACSGSTKHARTTGDWKIMTADSGKNMLCYAGTVPIKSEGTFEKRGQAYLMATRRPSGKIEISTSSGYPYKPHSKVELVTEVKPHRLFSKNDIAWAKDDAEDKIILTELKKSSAVIIRGVSDAGATSLDTYSTTGFADAITRIKALCP